MKCFIKIVNIENPVSSAVWTDETGLVYKYLVDIIFILV